MAQQICLCGNNKYIIQEISPGWKALVCSKCFRFKLENIDTENETLEKECPCGNKTYEKINFSNEKYTEKYIERCDKCKRLRINHYFGKCDD